MYQNPPSEADSNSASQDIPRLLWNPKIHCRVRKSPLLVPRLSQMNPINNFPLYFPKIRCNIMLPEVSSLQVFALNISH